MLKKKWRRRPLSKTCNAWSKQQGFNDLLSVLIAGRFSDPEILEKALLSTNKDLDLPDSLPDISKAAERVADAIEQGEIIALETDHDADGITSHAVLHEVITTYFNYPSENLLSFIGHRLKEGYGLSDSLAQRILVNPIKPALIITADNGSSDEPRIALLKRHGIDTIVTDHHEIPDEGIPKSAYAVVSPARADSQYPDKMIAGCMVACLLMAMTRKILMHRGYFTETPPSVSGVFDYVALGTVADCVSMAKSKNNRLIVKHGLRLINQANRPCWQALKENGKEITSTDLAFGIAPKLNASGRLDDAMVGVEFLLSQDASQAVEINALLDGENQKRKEIEKNLKDEAMILAEESVKDGFTAIVTYLKNGHAGVHGIVASRLTEAFGRPSIVISPKLGEEGVASASARGVEGLHVRDALQYVANKDPNILIKFGGHEGAAGLTLRVEDIPRFRKLFDEAVNQQINESNIGPVILTDGEIAPYYITLNTVDSFNQLQPFGRGMDAPVFEAELVVDRIRRIGNGAHLSIQFNVNGSNVKGVWFNALDAEAEDSEIPISPSETCRVLFSMDKNFFRGQTSLQLMIKDIA
ncbi:single-stranded-DNA-specific exonuclease RecJ (plasmid) [Methylomarinum sp. Ch1-1]|uniref:Single-stranded-DNA-specific exonuclease RecJ n=1 Tax=Methylomarinum roseum TaxID=3067653 RepID=A0AAU7P0A1_9GAMM|nr:single-stranded-DNA-specific exonuclease RecJ [Methylomarinum sp. Ch1-1]MDP4523285.1 single-stranded-DNA-specific exonuclease RecJ [Methylomarinum sp. Ch1-1]